MSVHGCGLCQYGQVPLRQWGKVEPSRVKSNPGPNHQEESPLQQFEHCPEGVEVQRHWEKANALGASRHCHSMEMLSQRRVTKWHLIEMQGRGRVNLTVAPEIGAEKTYTSQFPRKSHRRHRSKVLGIRVLVFGGALHCNAITQCGDGFGVTESGSKCVQQMAGKRRGNVALSITNCVVHASETWQLLHTVGQVLPGGKPHKKSQPVVCPSHRPVAHFKFKSGHRAILA